MEFDVLISVVLLVFVTALNIIGYNKGIMLLSVFSFLGLVISIPVIWATGPMSMLILITTLANMAILIKGWV